MAQKRKTKPAPTKTKKQKTVSSAVKIKQTASSIHISFSNPAHVIPHLLDLASDLAGKHFATAVYTSPDQDVLGSDAARDIVGRCANSKCWNCKLSDLGLESNGFQKDVYDRVRKQKYVITRDSIPDSQDTPLYMVVMAIQDAKKEQ